MPGTIFFRDSRLPDGIDHVLSKCLLYKNDDVILLATLPDGERFFVPDGDRISNPNPPPAELDPKRPFSIPSDVSAPIKALVDVDKHANLNDCPVFMIPDGGTLSYDGTTFTVIPPTPPNGSGPKPGCAVLVFSLFGFGITAIALNLFH